MGGLKILAIRAFDGTPKSILKALHEGELYKFHPEYRFLNNNLEEVKEGEEIVEIKSTIDLSGFYCSKPNINISAVVGKNGSGKSSINDLLYFFNFLVSTSPQLKFIKKPDYLTLSYFNNSNKWKSIKDVPGFKSLIELSHIELYFEKEKKKYRWVYRNDSIIKEELNGSWNKIDEPIEKSDKRIYYSDLPYTIAINYSLYGLNGDSDYWLNSLFHKNDGYQVPIVINPYREGGSIDVQSELHLSQSRALSNLINTSIENPILIGDKKLNKITLEIIPETIISIRQHPFSNLVKQNFESKPFEFFNFFNQLSNAVIGTDYKDSWNSLYPFFNEDLSDNLKTYERSDTTPTPNRDKIKYLLIKYAVMKVIKTCVNQIDYSKFLTKESKDKLKVVYKLNDTQKLLKQIKVDESHVNLKLRQVLYTIKNDTFLDGWNLKPNPKNLNNIAYFKEIDFKEYKEKVLKTIEDNPHLRLNSLESIPNAMFRPTLHVKWNDNEGTKFDKLSSGEQQFINVIQTINYHLKNIESVHKIRYTRKYKYSSVNLILDEIELYFHPEFQQKFIAEIIKSIRQLSLEKIKNINILFSTHSPFILSDIPSSSILRLKNGKPEPEANQTFGANIHELLANDFFLNEGFMGQFARQKINDLIDDLQNHINQSIILNENKLTEIERTINIIGEPLLKSSLNNLYIKAIPEKKVDFLQKQIDKLIQLQNL